MIKKPLSLDHYTYLNQLLGLDSTNRLEPKKDLTNKEELIKQLEQKQAELEALKKLATQAEIEANLLKIQRALEMLRDESKKKIYDEALTQKPQAEIKALADGKGIEIVPLVSIEEIVNEYNDFIKELCGMKDEQGNSLFAEGDFKYEKIDGNPTVHIFHFPNAEARNNFLGRLFNKNMAMLANGSQDINSVKNIESQKEMKEQLAGLNAEPEEQEAKSSLGRK